MRECVNRLLKRCYKWFKDLVAVRFYPSGESKSKSLWDQGCGSTETSKLGLPGSPRPGRGRLAVADGWHRPVLVEDVPGARPVLSQSSLCPRPPHKPQAVQALCTSVPRPCSPHSTQDQDMGFSTLNSALSLARI